MSRLLNAIVASTAAATLLTLAAPASAHGPDKTTKHETSHGHPVHTMTTHAQPRAATHIQTHQYEKSHARASARYIPAHRETATQHGIARETVTKLEDESDSRFHEMGHTATPLGHVVRERSALRVLTERRPNITNARFVTGTVLSRQNNTVVLRTQSGSTVTVLAQSIPLASTVLLPGTAVVLPVQFVNNELLLVPAFTTAQQSALASPVLAPCAINDYDADDAGDNGYYAPANACLNNDGDADDGNAFTVPALPSSFGSLPQVFTQSYAPVVAAGFVVARMGSNVLLMTPDFKPLVVNASAAFASGATNGSVTPGRYVVVSGFDVNNTLVATSLM